MFIKAILVIGAIGGSLLLASPASAQSNCATPGTAILQGVPATRQELLPSQAREIGGYGRGIVAGNCKVSLLCVSANEGDAAKDFARKQCVVVRDQLVRAGVIKSDIDTSRKNPGSGRTAGIVYLTAL